MEDELRLSLLVAGTCFIIAVLAHGIWKIRKNDKPHDKPRVEPRQWGDEIDDGDDNSLSGDFDELGLGKVRVIKANAEVETSLEVDNASQTVTDLAEGENEDSNNEQAEEPLAQAEEPLAVVEPDDASMDDSVTDATQSTKTKLYGSVVSNPKPHLQDQYDSPSDAEEQAVFPEPPEFLLKEETGDTVAQEDTSTAADDVSNGSLSAPPDNVKPVYKYQADEASVDAPQGDDATPSAKLEPKPVDRTPEPATPVSKGKRNKSSQRKRKEPNFGNDQMRIDFDETQEIESKGDAASSASDTAPVEQEVLVLNVRTPEDSPISGAALLPMLLTLGFKFGDQNIFHRHVNANGKGPVLFSLANMFKPGVFDIDSMETFTTQGVSLFMILPIEGDPHQVFNMMHNAARKLADEFNAQVLDGRRSVLTKQGLQQYVEKIREFERRRIISRQ